MHDLFANYSKEVRPVIDKEKPIPVNFDMMFSQLVELVRTLHYNHASIAWNTLIFFGGGGGGGAG